MNDRKRQDSELCLTEGAGAADTDPPPLPFKPPPVPADEGTQHPAPCSSTPAPALAPKPQTRLSATATPQQLQLRPATKTIHHFFDHISRLYEQGAEVDRIGKYIALWHRWVQAGVMVKASTSEGVSTRELTLLCAW